MNAYASGIDERSYAITVTSGLLAALNKDCLLYTSDAADD